jgi:hypothetical protein
MDEIICPFWQRICGNIMSLDGEVRILRSRYGAQIAQIDVSDEHVSSGADLPGKPDGNRATAAPDLQAVPALADATRFKIPDSPGIIEDPKTAEALTRLRRRVVEDIVLHDSLR